MIRTAIVTLAGTSRRFSASVGRECHKSFFRETPEDATLLDWQLELLRRNSFDHVVLVGGYRFGELRDHMRERHPDTPSTLVFNDHYADLGSCHSLCLGIDAVPDGTDSVVFLEGDLLFDDATFSQMAASEGDAITAAPGFVDARTSVAFCVSPEGRLRYVYDTAHSRLCLDGPFVLLGNSGQVWQFADVSRLRECSRRCGPAERSGTNLLPILDYFSPIDATGIPIFTFRAWFNCNTLEDYRAMKDYTRKCQ